MAGDVRSSIRELFGQTPQPETKFWFEDYFTSIYYCIDEGADIKVRQQGEQPAGKVAKCDCFSGMAVVSSAHMHATQHTRHTCMHTLHTHTTLAAPTLWYKTCTSACVDRCPIYASTQVLGELFTAEATVEYKDKVGTAGWPVTNQPKHSIIPKLVDITANVDIDDQLDCSGGGRQIYIEHVETPFNASKWDPCLAAWRLGDYGDYRLDYCWFR